MAYSQIRLVGGPADGTIWGEWTGVGLFQVHVFPKGRAVDYDVTDCDPTAVTMANERAMYQAARVNLWGRNFSFAHPVDMQPADALALLFPGGQFAGVPRGA